jgi:triosephosphate isomerase
MLMDVGCEWVILGHSERRKLYGETSGIYTFRRVATEVDVHAAVVAAKIAAVLQHKNSDGSARLRVIACVGETLEERQAGNTMQVQRLCHRFPVPGFF